MRPNPNLHYLVKGQRVSSTNPMTDGRGNVVLQPHTLGTVQRRAKHRVWVLFDGMDRPLHIARWLLREERDAPCACGNVHVCTCH